MFLFLLELNNEGVLEEEECSDYEMGDANIEVNFFNRVALPLHNIQ